MKSITIKIKITEYKNNNITNKYKINIISNDHNYQLYIKKEIVYWLVYFIYI